MTNGCTMRKTMEDIQRAAKCEKRPAVRQLAILILVELNAGASFADPYVEELFHQLEDRVGCNISDEEV